MGEYGQLSMVSSDAQFSQRGSLTATATVLAAASFAARKHAGQFRKGRAREPYINHPLEVAELVAGCAAEQDVRVVAAALLHDVIEDTDATRAELVAHFGEDVADLVAELSDDNSLPKHVRKELQVRNAARKSPRAQLISLADKISNLRGVLHDPPVNWSFQRRAEYVAWAGNVVRQFTDVPSALKLQFDELCAAFEEMKSAGNQGRRRFFSFRRHSPAR
jgi:(p)ppGpp synthase/HD superfamily hydrolase